MRLVDPPIQPVYLPNHPVVKASSTTTKTRVVFNASSPSSNQSSLNDHQMVGRKLQVNLPMLLTRWRVHRFVYCAAIEKLFRQILVDERDVDYQRILWRADFTEKIQEYQLLTVTYGTASAPFLAMKVLQQLAFDEGQDFPLASLIIQDQIYVDDCLFVSHSIELLKQMRDELIGLLRRAGLELRKWAGNSSELLNDLDPKNHGLACDKSLQPDASLKILGISWSPASDTYRFSVNSEKIEVFTKRVVLSIISKLFDPLGWLSPVVILAKIFMQSLWLYQIDCDDISPDELFRFWIKFYHSLDILDKLQISRWIETDDKNLIGEIHGFSDASTVSYAAVVYLRVVSKSGSVQISLLLSKTKVAPEKQVSVPRLELCGAVLLARVMRKLLDLPEFRSFKPFGWTDSSIVRAWLRLPSSNWKTFVANRVSEIHTLISEITWRHVPGSKNPADLASRGIQPEAIISNSLWWQGPPWLSF